MKAIKGIFILSFLSLSVLADPDNDCNSAAHEGKISSSISLKVGGIFSILATGISGVCLPSLGRWLPFLRPEKYAFFIIKAFAAGIILATGFVHILPDAFDSLNSPCLKPNPWQDFPFAGFMAMTAAIGTMAVDTAASHYYRRPNSAEKEVQMIGDVEQLACKENACGHVQPHGGDRDDITRHRVVSHVLELGIVVHSIIIGISLGVSNETSTIRPLIIALSFHQFFEGMGLGGCLVQAQFSKRMMVTMILFFSLTTPAGIGIGIGIKSAYNENSPTALIVEGMLNAGASGILVYMALVDLLAADFMNPRVQQNGLLQLLIFISLLFGAGFMSLLAKWA